MKFIVKRIIITGRLLLFVFAANAQTDIDALMMPKQNFCGGLMYGQSNWKNSWEGTFKRDNQNLGTVTTSMVNIMGNYGVTDKLNLLFPALSASFPGQVS